MTSLYETCELPSTTFTTGRNSLEIIDKKSIMDTLNHIGRSLHLPQLNGKHHGPLEDMVETLRAADYKMVLDRTEVLNGAGGILGPDHLFSHLLKNNMVLDNAVLMSKGTPAEGSPGWSALHIVVAYQLGTNVCGHPGIVHGGMSAAMIDESLGYLLYLVRNEGALAFERVLTARMEVDYKAPMKPNTSAVVTARIASVEGKKVWVECALADKPLTAAQLTAALAPRGAANPAPSADEPCVAATTRALFIAQPAAPKGVDKKASTVSEEGTPADV